MALVPSVPSDEPVNNREKFPLENLGIATLQIKIFPSFTPTPGLCPFAYYSPGINHTVNSSIAYTNHIMVNKELINMELTVIFL